MPSASLVKRCGIAVLAMNVLSGCQTCLDVELRDAATLAPIENARVTVYPLYVFRLDRPQPVEGFTHAQGKVAFPDVGATHHYTLWVDVPGQHRYEITFPPPGSRDRSIEWTTLNSRFEGAAEIEARITECAD